MRSQLFKTTIICALVLFAATWVWADGTETLGPPSVDVGAGTGIVGAGTGLVDGSGTIDIDVPGAVQQVLLYWGCFSAPGDQDNQESEALPRSGPISKVRHFVPTSPVLI